MWLNNLSLKWRLNLIITGLLGLVFIAGVVLNIINARQNVRAEIESTEKLALYLFNNGSNKDYIDINNKEINAFHLESLKHMRHVRIEFYDPMGKLLDSNRQSGNTEQVDLPPHWFKVVLDVFSPKWQALKRPVQFQEKWLGDLVITPDPTYEYAEIWKQMIDLLLLLLLFFVAVNLMIAWALGKALEPTISIFNTLNQLEGGNLQARLPAFKLPEVDRIGEKFNHMVETLEQSHHRNHRLSQQLISLQENERKNLARDLHDEFGQCLTAIHADATVVSQLAKTKYPELIESANAITKLSKHLMEMVGGLLQRLRPGALDELGLVAALQELVSMWQVRNEQCRCKLLADELPKKMNEVLNVTLYRLVQECLTNVTRHSEAKHVIVELTMDNSEKNIMVCVEDDGKGFDISQLKGFGLLGMAERVEGLGGILIIESRINNGRCTRVKANLPLVEVIIK